MKSVLPGALMGAAVLLVPVVAANGQGTDKGAPATKPGPMARGQMDKETFAQMQDQMARMQKTTDPAERKNSATSTCSQCGKACR